MNKEFMSWPLCKEGIENLNYIKSNFDGLLSSLKTLCPESREFSICKTKLEEACFYAIKAMASNGVNQKVCLSSDGVKQSNE